MPTDLHPDFPVVSGDYAMTKDWRIKLDQDFNRRIDEGSLVLWRPELTLWINIWNSDGKVAVDDVLTRLLADASAQRSDEQIESTGAMARLTYELAEDDADREQSSERSINGFVIYPAGYVQIAAYYDTPAARAAAYDIIGSVRPDS